MAHGFNDDKSKAEMYTKDEIVVKRFLFNNVAPHSETAESSMNYGDTEYTIISALQELGGYKYNAVQDDAKNVYPKVKFGRVYDTSTTWHYELIATGYNPIDTRQGVAVEVVLLKVD